MRMKRGARWRATLLASRPRKNEAISWPTVLMYPALNDLRRRLREAFLLDRLCEAHRIFLYCPSETHPPKLSAFLKVVWCCDFSTGRVAELRRNGSNNSGLFLTQESRDSFCWSSEALATVVWLPGSFLMLRCLLVKNRKRWRDHFVRSFHMSHSEKNHSEGWNFFNKRLENRLKIGDCYKKM